jgi:hypothetical protein
MPAQAGIQSASAPPLDSRFCGNDEPAPFNARLLGAFAERKVTYELLSNSLIADSLFISYPSLGCK